ncbi:protein FAR-RED ELONGATED HYPOCOTYL 3-like [Phaseolus vulgaris]|uniref:protein FAR-RED ELONGATED HYPOCOTYL 3-like n=1 Tax=Phaseolus vulgaris TaxID=3885 RepID=UPI0035C99309
MYKVGLEVTVTDTRKCQCPFKLRGKPIGKGQDWVLKVICGTHNHNLYDTLVGYPYADRLNANEHSMLVHMTKSTVKPGNILCTLKENNEDNMTTIKLVYNARYLYKRSGQLLLMTKRYTCRKKSSSSNIVSDILWNHPDAVKLLNAFNVVFLMDMTYKTNKYRLPLFEIVGVTYTCLSFSAGFVFLTSEKEKNYIWALQKIRGSLLTSHVGPEVIVSDKDLALMNAISTVFSKATNLLCRFHINKNVKEKCKMLVDSVEA